MYRKEYVTVAADRAARYLNRGTQQAGTGLSRDPEIQLLPPTAAQPSNLISLTPPPPLYSPHSPLSASSSIMDASERELSEMLNGDNCENNHGNFSMAAQNPYCPPRRQFYNNNLGRVVASTFVPQTEPVIFPPNPPPFVMNNI